MTLKILSSFKAVRCIFPTLGKNVSLDDLTPERIIGQSVVMSSESDKITITFYLTIVFVIS